MKDQTRIQAKFVLPSTPEKKPEHEQLARVIVCSSRKIHTFVE
ncbi:MAG TPA: hypothetical protein VHM93_18580 [Candidatus Acidoferrum sp.]|jgi:hypothetical protein|nr:hypothetical protein [Candidatus Acidoferrum sp.]